jgi:hypothetical protein
LDQREINQEGSLENYIMRSFTINSAPGTVRIMTSGHMKLVVQREEIMLQISSGEKIPGRIRLRRCSCCGDVIRI